MPKIDQGPELGTNPNKFTKPTQTLLFSSVSTSKLAELFYVANSKCKVKTLGEREMGKINVFTYH